MYKTGKTLVYLKEGSIGNGRNQCSLSVNKPLHREQTNNLTLDLAQAGSITGHRDTWLIWAGFVEERRGEDMPDEFCCTGWRAARGAVLNQA